MMPDSAFTFSILHDRLMAGAAQADLVADALAASDYGNSFLMAFGDILKTAPNAQRTYLVARHGQLVVVMVILVMDTAVTLPGVAQIAGIITRTAYRKKGIARQLLQMAGSMAAKNEKPVLTLNIAASDPVAGFFTKAGFAVNGIEPGFSSLPDGRVIDTTIYWKRFS